MLKAERIVHNHFAIPNIVGVNENQLVLVTNSNDKNNFSCEEGTFKFGLLRKSGEDEQLIFKFDFFEVPERLRNMQQPNEPPTIRLEQIWVQSDYRGLKIATYYMNKLVEYAKQKNIKIIKMIVNPNAEIFKGDDKNHSMSKAELKAFYKSFESEEVEIKFIE